MPNQWKPTPPLDIIEPHILRLWKARQTDKQIVAELQKHFDTSRYGLGLTKFLKVREGMGLRRTRQQFHTVDTIRKAMTDLRQTYPNAGAREVVSLFFHERNMSVARSVVISYFNIYEPELVLQRKANHLRRRCFWAAGVNDIFAVDQHDKWLRYGLGLHTGIEPFSGRIMWMRVWHSNRNPQLILSYYLDTLDMLGHMPMVTQSDPGSENFGIANAHTMLCQWHDPALQGTLQHRWMRNKKNVMPEITWSQMRRWFTPGFESLLDHGVMSGWYNSNNTLQMMVFRWVFIPWLQRELDAYQDRVNNTRKRRDRNKILPHGVPNLVYQSPENFGALNFKITVECEALDHVRNLYINPSHVVFDLVPQSFGKLIQRCYEELGRPSVTRQSVWDVYLHLLDVLQVNEEIPSAIEDVEEDLPLLENHQDLPYREESNGTYYMGRVGGGLGLSDEHLHQLDNIAQDDEPETIRIDEDIVGLDHDGLVIWEFSDDSGDGDADVVDEW
ncbi:hypothetical protein EV702DRAFT_1220104 [Suillus placidus]|uniref:Integrase core domain-containing protein n=1 Tax=Suillus placidus TaxID=48579 RepID=A0A9P6ZYT0_9AGAM|nr:hypothetical protein EV702DRAFT_1220104 [Suillus placidus]